MDARFLGRGAEGGAGFHKGGLAFGQKHDLTWRHGELVSWWVGELAG
jgi:hypothetical protein